MAVPPEYSSRPLTVDDAEAVTDILASVERAEPAEEHYSVEDVEEELSAPGVELGRGSIGVFAGGALVGFGFLRCAPAGEAWRAHLLGGVDPAHGRRGLGGHILDRLLALAQGMRAAAGDLPGEVSFEVEGTRYSAAALAASRGFTPLRRYSRMQRDLSDPVVLVEPRNGITIRGYHDGDADAVRLAYNTSFADSHGFTPSDPERWHAGTEGAESFRPGMSFVALAADGSVVGFLLAAEYQAETEERGFRTGYVDVLGTVPAARGSGVASALLSRCLTAMAADGYAIAELGTEDEGAEPGNVAGVPGGSIEGSATAGAHGSAARLYVRAGFSVVAHGAVYGLSLPPAVSR